MSEWLILLLVVPAVVVPAVLLAGFAGCGFSITAGALPKIEDAVGMGISRIALTVSYSTALRGFEFERKRLPELTVETFTVDASTSPDTFEKLDDTHYRVMDRQLERKTLYLYRVRAIDTDGSFSSWSNPLEPDILAETLDFRTTFEWTEGERGAAIDASPWEGFCLIQRISPSRLALGGDFARITLRAASDGGASIERVYISQPDATVTTTAMDPYDSAADLTEVPASRVDILENDTVELTVPYRLDNTKALLIIVDFSASPPSAIRGTDAVVLGHAYIYSKMASNQAMLRDRTGFSDSHVIRLVEKIEVG